MNFEMACIIFCENRRRIQLYQNFKDYYSYGFYIARKNKTF